MAQLILTKEVHDQIKWDLLHGEIDQLFDILDGLIFKSAYHADLLVQIENRAENLRLEATAELQKLPKNLWGGTCMEDNSCINPPLNAH